MEEFFIGDAVGLDGSFCWFVTGKVGYWVGSYHGFMYSVTSADASRTRHEVLGDRLSLYCRTSVSAGPTVAGKTAVVLLASPS
jgi:hypothetical protein